MGAGHPTSCVSMGAGHLCKVSIITLATPLPSPIRISLVGAFSMILKSSQLSFEALSQTLILSTLSCFLYSDNVQKLEETELCDMSHCWGPMTTIHNTALNPTLGSCVFTVCIVLANNNTVHIVSSYLVQCLVFTLCFSLYIV